MVMRTNTPADATHPELARNKRSKSHMSTLHTTTTLSNQYVDIPELASAKEVAHKSFDFKDKAATQNGKAVQGMAYAIMVCWFNWHQDDKEGKLPSLVDCIHANKSD